MTFARRKRWSVVKKRRHTSHQKILAQRAEREKEKKTGEKKK